MKGNDGVAIDVIIERAVRGEASDGELVRLAAWRRASPANERIYRDRVHLLEVARTLRADAAIVPPRPSADAIIVAAKQRRVLTTGQRIGRWGGWIAAAAAAVVLLTMQVREPVQPTDWVPAEIVTGDAELATVKLGDGTIVRLAPSSRLRIEAGVAREVTLDGRAFFAVTEAADGRPFRVHTAAATANVLGTRFELVSEPDSVRLLVIEGRVSLDARENTVEVGAGEESGVRRGVASPARRTENPGEATAWLGRFLVFQATPLREASREIERLYGVRVVIAHEELTRATITAAFTDRTVEDVFDVVCTVLNATCTTQDGTVTIAR
jgi:transmembrane sensor